MSYKEAAKHTKALAGQFRSLLEFAEAVENVAQLEAHVEELTNAVKNKKDELKKTQVALDKAKHDHMQVMQTVDAQFKDANEKADNIVFKAQEKVKEAQKEAVRVVAEAEVQATKKAAAADADVQKEKDKLLALRASVEKEEKKLEKLRQAVKEIVDRSV